MLFVVKPVLARLLDRAVPGTMRNPAKGVMALVMAPGFCLRAGDRCSDGNPCAVRRIFGGESSCRRSLELREFLRVRLEHFSSAFLLPLFFAFTGLRLQVGSLNDSTGWLICAALIAIATFGKLGGAMFDGALERDDVERFLCVGRLDEHARAGGIDRVEHRVRSGDSFARDFCPCW